MKFRLATLMLSLACFGQSANAAIQVFFTQAAFDAALASNSLNIVSNINFEALNGDLGTNFNSGGVNFSIPGVTQMRSDNSVTPTNSLGISDLVFSDFGNGEPLSLAVPANRRAISVDLVSNSLLDAVNFLSLNVGGDTATTINHPNPIALGGGYSSYFIGLLGMTPGDAFSLATATSSSSSAFFRVDNVRVAAVPEPSSMLLAGFASLLCFRRRRSR
jgi:hypothetical protein